MVFTNLTGSGLTRVRTSLSAVTSALAIGAFGMLFLTDGVAGQELSRYRDYVLTSNLAAVSTLAGVAASAGTTIHQRPALLQDLEWRSSRWLPGSIASTDPVEKITFSFYNDQLFRVNVDYGLDRTEGMTDVDLVDAVAAVYGTPLKALPVSVRPLSLGEVDTNAIVARWGDAARTAVLYRTSSYGQAFRLIVTDVALDDLARKATVQAVRLDAQEAPQREMARQNKDRNDKRDAAEKARQANKRGFKP